MPDFPNLFIFKGPNTNAGHGGSAILACEFQVRYIMQGIALLASGDLDQLEVTEQAFWGYNHELDAELNKCIWSHPDCEHAEDLMCARAGPRLGRLSSLTGHRGRHEMRDGGAPRT